MAKQSLIFHSEDTGFCRVYYRGERDKVLYSLDTDTRGNVESFHQCTKDGEPAWPCTIPEPERLSFIPDNIKFPEPAE